MGAGRVHLRHRDYELGEASRGDLSLFSGIPRRHAFSVVGLDGDRIIIRNPLNGRLQTIDQSLFFKKFRGVFIART